MVHLDSGLEMADRYLRIEDSVFEMADRYFRIADSVL